MAYIGKSIESGTFSVLDTSGNTYNGSNTAFNLGTQVGSVAQLLVSHDGVIQKPGTDYTLSSGGAAITFTTAPASGASIFIVEISGAVGGPLDSDLNGTELILDADGDTSITADTDDQIDIKIAGADDFNFTANTFTAASGSTIAGQAVTATTVVGSGAAQFATAGVGAAKDLGVGLHIRTADSGASVDNTADELVIEGSGDTGLSILSGASSSGSIVFGDSGDNNDGVMLYNQSANRFIFTANGVGNEVLRMDANSAVFNEGSGDTDFRIESNGLANMFRMDANVDMIWINNSDSIFGQGLLQILAKANETAMCIQVSSNGERAIHFANASGVDVGDIVLAASSTAYNTSSDYRLKENVTYDWDATTRLKKLKPARFNWIVDKTNTLVDGFLAHEAQTVVPEAVTGTKDATLSEVLYTENKLYEEGDELPEGKNIGDIKHAIGDVKQPATINSQKIDHSKLVPLLVKTVQELEARIATLEG